MIQDLKRIKLTVGSHYAVISIDTFNLITLYRVFYLLAKNAAQGRYGIILGKRLMRIDGLTE